MFLINNITNKYAINVSIIHVVCLIACLALYAECQCMNNDVNCNGISSTSIQCDILSLKTDYTKRFLFVCSTGSFTSLTIRITPGGYGANIELDLPQNITTLFIDNPSSTSCSIETFETNLFLTRISFIGQTIRIGQPNFFNHFINLRRIEASSTAVINFEDLPTFTQNKQLTFIRLYESTIQKESGRVITDGFILGLENLTSLTWENGQITGIEPNAFTGVTNLGMMSLNDNQIRALQDYSFEGLSSLTFLRLDNNNISTVSNKALSGLTRIRSIDLDRNPTFPLNTITPLKSLQQVFIWYYNPEYLTPEPFQQLPELTIIEMYYIQFNCDCSKQWLSRLSNFGIIRNFMTICTEPPEFASENPTDASLYTNCPSRSYPCFNHSIACNGEDWIRVDSGNKCNCICKTGYSYSPQLDACSDANECLNDSMCEQTCVNTVGSYLCGCMGGYLLKNGTYCQDIDECMIGNTSCAICTNTMGSYACSCPDGYSLSGFSDCVDINECQLSNGGCQQICINTEGGYNCACGSGYAVSADNLSYCQDVNECPLNNGGCQHACQNIEGGFFCNCSVGYELSPLNPSSCIDINECLVNNGNCHHICHNFEGSYNCSCRENYSPSSSNINHCEADQDTITNQSRNEIISPQVYIPIIIAIIFFFVTLVLICTLVVMCCAVSKQKKISADESRGKTESITRGYCSPTDLRINIPKRITQSTELREYEQMSPSKYSEGPVPSKYPIEQNGFSKYTQDPSDLNKKLSDESTSPKREYEAMSPSHLSQPNIPEYAEVGSVYTSIVEENRYYEM